MGIRQFSLITALVAGGACSGFRGNDPAPVAPVPAASPVQRPVESATSPVPVPIAPASPATDEIRVAADSAADAAVLEQLALAGASSEVSLEPFAASGTALDLTTYSSHERVRYYLDFFQGPGRDRMNVWLGRLPVYEQLARTRFEAAGLPSDLIYLAIIESGFSNVAVSRSRAVGMWQFMAPTGRWMGLRVDSWVDERRDPVRATDAAARYLVYLRDKFGSIYLAAAAYNGGPGTVSRGLTRGGVTPAATQNGDQDEGAEDEVLGWSDADFFTLADTRYLRSETKDYVPKLIAASLIARDPLRYGFSPLPAGPAFPLDSVVVPDMTGLDVVAELAGVSVTAIRELNPHYLRLVTPPGTSAVIRVPAGTAERVATGYASLPASKRIRYREHSVRSGETLGAIARKYGVSVADLRMANPAVRKSSLIRVGQVLVVPTAGGPAAGGNAAPSTRSASSHVVRSGETLSVIGSRYRVSTSQLIGWNKLPSNGLIKPGQRLRLTAPETSSAASNNAGGTRTHLVKKGETLGGIARRYGVTVVALKNANGIAAPSQLQAGKRIRIPS